MTKIRHTATAFLLVLTVLMTGLAGVAHALSSSCLAMPCDTHMSGPAGPSDVVPDAGERPASPGDHMADDGCNPSICHALALAAQPPKTDAAPPPGARGWQVGHLSALQEPEHPDRPPNH